MSMTQYEKTRTLVAQCFILNFRLVSIKAKVRCLFPVTGLDYYRSMLEFREFILTLHNNLQRFLVSPSADVKDPEQVRSSVNSIRVR